jgi:hypothetical protein
MKRRIEQFRGIAHAGAVPLFGGCEMPALPRESPKTLKPVSTVLPAFFFVDFSLTRLG